MYKDQSLKKKLLRELCENENLENTNTAFLDDNERKNDDKFML